MSFVTVNDVRLRYDWRPAAGMPLVLLHEMGGTLESWDLVLRHLPSDQAVLRMDLRGFGLSEKPSAALTMEALVADLVALTHHLGINQMHLAGGAVGGGVAIAAAAALGPRAVRLTGLAPATGVPPERRAGLLALAGNFETQGVRPFLEADTIPKAWPMPRFARDEGFELFLSTQLSTAPASLAATYRMLAAIDLVPVLASLTCPVTLVAGIHDIARPPDLIEALAAHCTKGRFQALDSGHFMALQSPQAIAELLA
ncbi:alpha/beta fold hydrolase [Rhizobium rhizogenes]|uniref:alpha/beta fold hydrolase n=1 Tax=Rhizobium rhizogenes TaxID=359 RepID=UPI0015729220|nr:alpha/beta hydrolase [Rhizobium rhizogenes]NTF97920.1 alpha/beta fold hydrolase [Rhizobium rhizogenes]